MLLNFSGKFSRVKPISSQISDQKEVRWLILVWPKLQDQKFTEKTGDSTIFQAEFGQKICEFIHWKQAVQCSIGSVVQCSAVFADFYTFSDPDSRLPKKFFFSNLRLLKIPTQKIKIFRVFWLKNHQNPSSCDQNRQV